MKQLYRTLPQDCGAEPVVDLTDPGVSGTWRNERSAWSIWQLVLGIALAAMCISLLAVDIRLKLNDCARCREMTRSTSQTLELRFGSDPDWMALDHGHDNLWKPDLDASAAIVYIPSDPSHSPLTITMQVAAQLQK